MVEQRLLHLLGHLSLHLERLMAWWLVSWRFFVVSLIVLAFWKVESGVELQKKNM
jgi:hypothetical protein